MNRTLQELIDEVAENCKDGYELLAGLVYTQSPMRVLELGTGAGHSGDIIMSFLQPEAAFTTINWPNPPSGDPVGEQLARWKDDPRLTQILGDTRDPSVAEQVPYDINLLFIDSGTDHNYDLIAAEWALYAQKLADKALVVVDDLDFPGGGVRRFWDWLEFEKVETKLNPYGFGVARFRRAA